MALGVMWQNSSRRGRQGEQDQKCLALQGRLSAWWRGLPAFSAMQWGCHSRMPLLKTRQNKISSDDDSGHLGSQFRERHTLRSAGNVYYANRSGEPRVGIFCVTWDLIRCRGGPACTGTRVFCIDASAHDSDRHQIDLRWPDLIQIPSKLLRLSVLFPLCRKCFCESLKRLTGSNKTGLPVWGGDSYCPTTGFVRRKDLYNGIVGPKTHGLSGFAITFSQSVDNRFPRSAITRALRGGVRYGGNI